MNWLRPLTRRKCFLQVNIDINYKRSYHKVYCNKYRIIQGNASILTIQNGYLYNSRQSDPRSRCHILHQPQREFSSKLFDDYIAAHSKFFQNVSESSSVENIIEIFKSFHDTTQFSWTASIILSTILLRSTITFPLSVYQHYIMAKIENLKKEMDKFVNQIQSETAFSARRNLWTKKKTTFVYRKALKKKWDELVIQENCHPFKASLVIWVQIPLWILLTISYRKMSTYNPDSPVTFVELSVGGFGWLPNLTEVDHSFILPVLFAVTNYLLIDINSSSKRQIDEKSKLRYLTYFLKLMCVAFVPIAGTVPGSVVLYWATSSTCALAHNLMLMNPRVRRLCRIPITESESQTPYKDLVHNLRKRYKLIK